VVARDSENGPFMVYTAGDIEGHTCGDDSWAMLAMC